MMVEVVRAGSRYKPLAELVVRAIRLTEKVSFPSMSGLGITGICIHPRFVLAAILELNGPPM